MTAVPGTRSSSRGSNRTPATPKDEPAHPKTHPFFKHTNPVDWSLPAYLTYIHSSDPPRSQDLFYWTKGLEDFGNCKVKGCCDQDKRRRARRLLEEYKTRKKQLKARKRRAAQQMRERKESPAPGGETIGSVGAGASVLVNSGTVNIYGVPLNSSFEEGVELPVQKSEDRKATSTADAVPKPDPEVPNGYSSSSNDSDHTVTDMTTERAEFIKTYSSIKPESMWKLSSGRRVETVIYDAVMKMDVDTSSQSLLRHFILDLTDPETARLFPTAELDELKKAFPPLPPPDKELHDLIKPFFKVKTLPDLRTLLRNSELDLDASTPAWVDTVLRQSHALFSSPNALLTTQHDEVWYTCRIWSHIIDSLLDSISGILVSRSEATSRSSAWRMNQGRNKTGGLINRQKMGPKLDGIIRTVGVDYLELGAIEVAKSYDGPGATKLLNDARKLRMVLRDMLARLHDEVSSETISKVQTVGILNAGLKLQLVRCWARNKGGVVLTMGEQMDEHPTGVEDLGKLWLLMKTMMRARGIVKEVGEIVGRRGGTVEDMTKAFFEE